MGGEWPGRSFGAHLRNTFVAKVGSVARQLVGVTPRTPSARPARIGAAVVAIDVATHSGHVS